MIYFNGFLCYMYAAVLLFSRKLRVAFLDIICLPWAGFWWSDYFIIENLVNNMKVILLQISNYCMYNYYCLPSISNGMGKHSKDLIRILVETYSNFVLIFCLGLMEISSCRITIHLFFHWEDNYIVINCMNYVTALFIF